MDSNNKAWLSEVGVGLLNAGLPVTYVARSVIELHDHLEDCECSDAALDDLGVSAQRLVQQFEDSYRQTTWRARVPYVAWLVTLVPLSLVVCLAYFGTMALFVGSIGPLQTRPDLERPLTWAFYGGKLITPAIAFYVLAWCVKPLRMSGWRYAILMLILAAIFFVTVSNFRCPTEQFDGGLTLHLDDEKLAESNLIWQLIQGGIVVLLSGTHFMRTFVRRHRLRAQLIGNPAALVLQGSWAKLDLRRFR